MKFTDFNETIPEGKLLLAAVSLLTGGNKTPESVMDELTDIAVKVYGFVQPEKKEPQTFEQELTGLINRHCVENESDTPDFILAAYILGSLENFNRAVRNRTNWYGNKYETPAYSQKDINDLTGSVKEVNVNQSKIDEFNRILEINKSGYAGVDQMGRIVDRREKPDAIPVPKNSIFNIPEPKPWPHPDKPDGWDFIKEDQI